MREKNFWMKSRKISPWFLGFFGAEFLKIAGMAWGMGIDNSWLWYVLEIGGWSFLVVAISLAEKRGEEKIKESN